MPAHLAADPDDVHREERQVEEHERRPEVQVARVPRSSSGRTSSGTSSRSPRTAPKIEPPNDDVVDVGDDEVRVLDVDVDRRRGHEDAREAADDEHRYERERVQHRDRVLHPGAPHGAEPVERLDAEGTAMIIVVTVKAIPSAGFMPLTNMWWP
jgi:hypothetical protein